MDKILINGLRLFAYHGVNPEEKEKGQPFEMDITLYLNLDCPCTSDNVEDTVSYAKVVKTVRSIFLAQKDDLLEHAAQRVADGILEAYTPVKQVKVLLKKPRAPIAADFAYVAVEIKRRRKI